MNQHKAIFIGAFLGVLLGSVFFIAYGAISYSLCQGNVNCPQRWESFAITSAIGWMIFILFTASVFWIMYRIYKCLSVD